MRTAPGRSIIALLLFLLASALAQGALLPDAGPPKSMRDLVLQAGHREILSLHIAYTEFHYLAPFSRLPFLLWPAEGSNEAPFEYERAGAEKWLEDHREALGAQGFHLVFREMSHWRGNEVWSFGLERAGRALHGAHIDVHWCDGRLQGLLCNLPGPIVRFVGETATSGAEDSNRVWYPVPRGTGWRDGADAVLALEKTEAAGPNIRTTYCRPSGELLATVVSPGSAGALPAPGSFQWTEYDLPTGIFPDQIDSDSQGLIWFSQPLNQQITFFDPVAETFDYVATPGAEPDGMIVDGQDMVWSGLYTGGRGLGRVEVNTNLYTVFPPPYGGALMAIPFSSSDGHIWVSDHEVNRMSEFDPAAESWVGTHTMPTPACWVVDSTEDPVAENLYFTEYNVNQLGMKQPGGPIEDIPVSAGGPAFAAYSHGRVYYTLWNRSALGAYDVVSGTNTEFSHPVANEGGGPMGLLSNGDVVVGSLNSGYVFIFRIADETWESYDIPTSNPGLKDGLHVDADDVIWITESGADKIAKLVIDDVVPPPVTRLVTGPGPDYANPPLVRVFPAEQGVAHEYQFSTYGPAHYGVNVFCGDVNGDGIDDLLTGAGPGDIFGPHVRGFARDGTPLTGLSFLAYATNKYGVNVSAGDLDGDGFDEIVTGAGPGAVFGPHARAFDYDGGTSVTPVPGVSFFAYGTLKWGVNVATGDLDGDGFDEIVTGAGPGAVFGPHVRGWNVDGGGASAIAGVSFLAYGTNRFGVNVACGDLDGDGYDEIITGPGPGDIFGPHVRGWNFDGASITPLPGFSFFAWPASPFNYGINVFAGADLNNDGRDELVAGRGPDPGANTEVIVFTYDGSSVSPWISLEAYPGLVRGTNVAAGEF